MQLNGGINQANQKGFIVLSGPETLCYINGVFLNIVSPAEHGQVHNLLETLNYLSQVI